MNSSIASLFFDYEFATSTEGWEAGFADYPVGEEEGYELAHDYRLLPEPLNQQRRAFFISGNNHSDDLFMFLKREVTGLRPSSVFELTFRIEVATNTPQNCPGVGGPLGEAVFMKAGASAIEPATKLEKGYHRLNLDKGNQGEGGSDLIVIGDLANSSADCASRIYEIKTLESVGKKLRARTSQDGTLWFIVGTDSGYEGITSLYYQRILIRLDC